MSDQDRNDPNDREPMGDEASRGGGSQGSERDRVEREESWRERQRRENPGQDESRPEQMPGDEGRREGKGASGDQADLGEQTSRRDLAPQREDEIDEPQRRGMADPDQL